MERLQAGPGGHLMGRERVAGAVQDAADEVGRGLGWPVGRPGAAGWRRVRRAAKMRVDLFLTRQPLAAHPVDRAAQRGVGVQAGAQRRSR